ncbi:MAG: hypothetical protein ACO1NZ_16225 [Adhaeribacter sp.]
MPLWFFSSPSAFVFSPLLPLWFFPRPLLLFFFSPAALVFLFQYCFSFFSSAALIFLLFTALVFPSGAFLFSPVTLIFPFPLFGLPACLSDLIHESIEVKEVKLNQEKHEDRAYWTTEPSPALPDYMRKRKFMKYT